ncbi:MAG: hypothetical protein AAFY31_06390 [Pseudomonadota bacterium]
MFRTTKFVALTCAALMLSPAAFSDTYFGYGTTLDEGSPIELGLITSDAAAVVEVYEMRGSEPGTLLGSEEIHAGANADVRVDTGMPVRNDILAVIRINGQIVAEKEFKVNSD